MIENVPTAAEAIQIAARTSGITEEKVKGCLDAMEAAFALHQAIYENDLTIDDLHNICNLALAEGHDLMQISLFLMQTAIERSGNVR